MTVRPPSGSRPGESAVDRRAHRPAAPQPAPRAAQSSGPAAPRRPYAADSGLDRPSYDGRPTPRAPRLPAPPATVTASASAPTAPVPAAPAVPAVPAAFARAGAPARPVASGPAGDGAGRAARADGLEPQERDRLLAGAHHDPHAVLGAHPVAGGVRFRVLRPYASAVAVVVDGRPTELWSEGDGLFGGVLPLATVPAYRLRVAYGEAGSGAVAEAARPVESAESAVRTERTGQTERAGRTEPAELTGQPGRTGQTERTRPAEPTERPGHTEQAEQPGRTGQTGQRGQTEPLVDDPYRFLPALGAFDLHLIREGRHEELWRALGAQPMVHQGVAGTRFTLWAPNARGVRVSGDFSYWDGTAYPMRSLGASGVWELFLPGVGPGALYKFDITRPDGSHTLRADPMARRTECPPATASVVHASDYDWQDGAWLERRGALPVHAAPFSVYEVHLPSWRPGLGYRELAEQLPGYVKDLGFTHVEFMPLAEHPFGGSWGYQVTGFYAPTARLGTPDDLKYLIDALHRAGIGVLLDWVPAHFPRDEWALAEFDGRPLYEHADPARAAHPDWGTLEFDYGRREVRNFLVANAVYWCEEFHVDGVRVDAVASMLYLDYSREPGGWTPNVHGGREDLDAVAFLQEMNATVYRRCPGVVTIAEESTAWDGVTRATHHVGPGGFGGLGFGLKWNMGWMHDSLSYIGHEPVHRAYHHHEMTFSMVYAYSENYVLPISHDEVVHGKRALVSKMPGDWWQQRANHRAYLGFMWAHPGKQLLFMGQEFAQGAEWSEPHGPDWWLLDPSYAAEPDHRGVRDLVRELNARYLATPALWERDTAPDGFAWIDGDAAQDNVFAFSRHAADGSPLVCVSNMSPVVRHGYRIGVSDEVPAWVEVLNTDEERYGGSGVGNPDPLKAEPTGWHGRPASLALVLPPLATVWLRPF